MAEEVALYPMTGTSPTGYSDVVLTNLTPSESAVTQVVTLTWGIEG